ncbi:MAG: hypothetical protein Q8Q33_06370 [Chlamydiota bacterium]|nr:hypothetical protein [Chlamydiota bacterium]
MEENKKKYRISGTGMALLIVGAIIADLISLIPFVGIISGPTFWIIASIYLWKAGCGLLNGKRLATSAISMIGEMAPVVQFLPLALVGIITVIFMVRVEDKTGIHIPVSGTKPVGGRVPLYQNGKRMPDIARNVASSEPLNIDGIRAPGGGLK